MCMSYLFPSIVIMLAMALTNVDADYGIDVSTPTSTDQFRCLLQNNFTFFIARTYRSIGCADTDGVQNILNAYEGIHCRHWRFNGVKHYETPFNPKHFQCLLTHTFRQIWVSH